VVHMCEDHVGASHVDDGLGVVSSLFHFCCSVRPFRVLHSGSGSLVVMILSASAPIITRDTVSLHMG